LICRISFDISLRRRRCELIVSTLFEPLCGVQTNERPRLSYSPLVSYTPTTPSEVSYVGRPSKCRISPDISFRRRRLRLIASTLPEPLLGFRSTQRFLRSSSSLVSRHPTTLTGGFSDPCQIPLRVSFNIALGVCSICVCLCVIRKLLVSQLALEKVCWVLSEYCGLIRCV
jgi:hypothetical protein